MCLSFIQYHHYYHSSKLCHMSVASQYSPSRLTIHADQDVINISAELADQIPRFRKHVAEHGYDVPARVEMNAVALCHVLLDFDQDVLPLQMAKYKQQLGFQPSLVGRWVDAQDSNRNW